MSRGHTVSGWKASTVGGLRSKLLSCWDRFSAMVATVNDEGLDCGAAVRKRPPTTRGAQAIIRKTRIGR
jgi:hypothetical protein